MQRFQTLRDSAYAVTYAQSYLQQGRYAEAMASTGAEPELVDRAAPAVTFADATSRLRSPRRRRQRQRPRRVLLFDVDNDGDLDLLSRRCRRAAPVPQRRRPIHRRHRAAAHLARAGTAGVAARRRRLRQRRARRICPAAERRRR